MIQAHNDDGDFEVFKYGLEPDSAKDCQNDAVAAYYHYGSISENAGTMDDVYYETYYDRDGNIMIPPKYRYVRNAEGGYYNPSFKNGRAIVHNGSGFGYVDTKGNFTPAPDLK